MNSISWFLYLADVLYNLQQVGIGIAIFGGIGLAALTAFLFVIRDDTIKHKKHYPSDYKDVKIPSIFSCIWFWFLYLFIVVSLALIPSKDTMYLIAGSEITEVVVNTPEAKEVLNETREAILRTIKGISKE